MSERKLSERMREAYDAGDNCFGVDEVTEVESLETENQRLTKLLWESETLLASEIELYHKEKVRAEEAEKAYTDETVTSAILRANLKAAESALSEARKLVEAWRNRAFRFETNPVKEMLNLAADELEEALGQSSSISKPEQEAKQP